MRLKDKVAVVTGANSGIGKAIADRFAKEGAKVIYSDINKPDFLSEKENGRFFIKCDATKTDEVQDLFKKAEEKFGKVDIAVCNAGIGNMGTILDTDDSTWNKVIEVNLSGVFKTMRAAANSMVRNKVEGSIINMCSILGRVGFNGAIAYCAAKGGAVQLTRAAAMELATSKVRVNGIAPGFIKTNMTNDALTSQDFNNLVTSATPMGYVGKPEDIANAALYLASDEAEYITGEILNVDGGWTAQ